MSETGKKSNTSGFKSRGSTASWRIRATQPDGTASEIFLVDGLTIGRTNANSIQACDDGSGVVERSHARVDFQNDGFVVLKCLSQSASVETGCDTVSSLRLDIGSTFRIGLTRFDVVASVAAEQTAAGSVGSACPYCGTNPSVSVCTGSVTECEACCEHVVGIPPTSKQGAAAVLPGSFNDTEGKQYAVERFVARGGMGYVLKGRTHEGAAVAIKVLIFDGTSDVHAVARFKQEITLLRALQDPNVLRLIAHGQQAGLFFFVMEWVEGADLRSLLPVPGKPHNRIQFSDALRWFEQACMGLHAIHRAGAVHRDIKPSNLLIRDDGQLLIGDLGVAKRVSHDETGMTCTGQLTGTYAYMAPEQQYAPDLVDARSDIYSLGLTFWQLLTGYPYSGVDPQRPSEANDTVPIEFDHVLLSMLKSRIDDRPSTMLDVLRALPKPAANSLAKAPGLTSEVTTAPKGPQDATSPERTGTDGVTAGPPPDRIARVIAGVEAAVRQCDALIKASIASLRPRVIQLIAFVAKQAARLQAVLQPRVFAQPPFNKQPPATGTSGESVARTDLGDASAVAARHERAVEKGDCERELRVAGRDEVDHNRLKSRDEERVGEVASGSKRSDPDHSKTRESVWQLIWCAAFAVAFVWDVTCNNAAILTAMAAPRRGDLKSGNTSPGFTRPVRPQGTPYRGWPSVPEPDFPSLPRPRPKGRDALMMHSVNDTVGKTRPAISVVPFDDAQARTHQQAWASYVSNKVTLSNSIGQAFALVPPGTFTMGQPESDTDETPHQVTLTKPFYIGVHEVNNAQWKRVMESVPSQWKHDSHPVEQISWDDAVEFCRKLSSLPEERQAGRVYRLPTEAEWEYACRAGTTTQYVPGDYTPLLFGYGWFDRNSDGRTAAVGQKKPNAFGLFDMHGNVWEWCSDWYGDYGQNAVTDPQGPSEASARVVRGGCWGSMHGNCRSARRNRYAPSCRYPDLGFRLALNPPLTQPAPPGADK